MSAKIPGSSASKIDVHNDIQAYMGYFGLPHIYMTINPNANHSPLFQVIYGDDSVNLLDQFPELVSPRECAIHLASDPIAGADFFELSLECIFQDLLGWDHKTNMSTKDGGILGHICAYYGTAELTEHAQLHAHFLIWLDGGLNPSEVHDKMKLSPKWKEQYFEFWEDIIYHHVPFAPGNIPENFEPRTQ
ncbi:MAG TPA: hypothetical protein VF974_02255 [Patescibacteria group bacterium]